MKRLLLISTALLAAVLVSSAMANSDKLAALDTYPTFINQAAPEYPPEAKMEGIEGTTTIKALIGKNGKAEKVEVAKSSGSKMLDDAAVEAAKQSTFSPGTQDGKPVAAWVAYTVNFKLEDKTEKTGP